MKPSININQKDPKLCLLNKILKFIDTPKTIKILSRNGIHNTTLFMTCLKIILISMYYNYTMSDVIRQLESDYIRRKYFKITELPSIQEFYEYISRYNAEQFNNITNSLLSQIHKSNKRPIKTYLVDATPVATDINILKEFITKERLEKLKLKWGYSTTKKYYIGFKVTVTLDKETLCPVSILIHAGAPHDTIIYEEVLKELKRRRLLAKRTLILFDRGYYSLENYKIGINRYKIIPIIFPKYENIEQKLSDNLAYPLEIYNKTNNKTIKQEYKQLKKILIQKITNWKELKPVRGLIEDFFKVAKDTFGLGQFHKYTTKSISKSIYICLLLTAICIQQGYNTKTKMQQLSEGNIELRPAIKHRRKKKETKTQKSENTKVPYKTKQTTLDKLKKEQQTTLFDYS